MIHQKNGKAIPLNKLNGYNRQLEKQILKTILETHSLMDSVGRTSKPDEMRCKFHVLANLKALRTLDFVSELDNKLGLHQ